MDRGAWWTTVHGVAKLDMTEPQSPHTLTSLVLYLLVQFVAKVNARVLQ